MEALCNSVNIYSDAREKGDIFLGKYKWMDATGYYNQSGLSHQKSPNKCEFYLSQSEKWIEQNAYLEHNCVLEILQISEKLIETMSVVSWMAGQRVPSSGLFLLNFQKFDVKTEMKGNADGMLNASSFTKSQPNFLGAFSLQYLSGHLYWQTIIALKQAVRHVSLFLYIKCHLLGKCSGVL